MNSNPKLAEYYDASAPPGSARALALVLTPNTTRPQARALVAFAGLMNRLAATHPEVAAAKLAWWHEELARAADDDGRHPVIREIAARGAVPVEQLTALLHGAVMAVNRVPVTDTATFDRYCYLSEGALHEALSLAAARTPGQARDFATAAGRALRLTRLFDGHADPLSAPKHWQALTPDWRATAHVLARDEFMEALERTRSAAAGDNATSYIMLDLARRRWQKNARVGRELPTLNPISALAGAWRSARRYHSRPTVGVTPA